MVIIEIPLPEYVADVDGHLGVKIQVLDTSHPPGKAANPYCSLFELIVEAIPAGIQET